MPAMGLPRMHGRARLPTNTYTITLYQAPIAINITDPNGNWTTFKTISISPDMLRTQSWQCFLLMVSLKAYTPVAGQIRMLVNGVQEGETRDASTEFADEPFSFAFAVQDFSKTYTITLQSSGDGTGQAKDIMIEAVIATVI